MAEPATIELLKHDDSQQSPVKVDSISILPISTERQSRANALLFNAGNACNADQIPQIPDSQLFLFYVPVIDASESITANCTFIDKIATVTTLQRLIPAIMFYNAPENIKDLITETQMYDYYSLPAESSSVLLQQMNSTTSATETPTDFISASFSPLYSNESYSILQFVIIVTAILLSLSLISSIVLHCHLFRLRRRSRQQRRQMMLDMEANGGNNGGENDHNNNNNNVQTLPRSLIDRFPKSSYKSKKSKISPNSNLKKTPVVVNNTNSTRVNLVQVVKSENLNTLHNNIKEIDDQAQVVSLEEKSGHIDYDDETVEMERIDTMDTKFIPDSQNSESLLQSITTTTTLHDKLQLQEEEEEKKEEIDSSNDDDDDDQLPRPQSTLSNNTMRSSVITNSEDDSCVICLEEYIEGEIIRTLPCQHYFHETCIDEWLELKSTCCPLCKADFKVEEEGVGPNSPTSPTSPPRLFPLNRDNHNNGSIRNDEDDGVVVTPLEES